MTNRVTGGKMEPTRKQDSVTIGMAYTAISIAYMFLDIVSETQASPLR